MFLTSEKPVWKYTCSIFSIATLERSLLKIIAKLLPGVLVDTENSSVFYNKLVQFA